jgi:beta-phosphoglucomutase
MKKLKLKVKAVIFDMDGVITNTMPDHFRVWKKIFSQEGVHPTHLDIYLREGQPGIDSVKEIFQTYKKPFKGTKAREILQRKEELFKKVVRRRFIAGARGFVRSLKRSRFKLALVTGTSRHELHRILPDFLYNLFDVVITGTDVKHGKPHPEPYQKALKKLRLKASGAVVIENAPFGIRSAKRAKIKCFAIQTSLPAQYLKEADRIFHSIGDIQNKVCFTVNKNHAKVRS